MTAGTRAKLAAVLSLLYTLGMLVLVVLFCMSIVNGGAQGPAWFVLLVGIPGLFLNLALLGAPALAMAQASAPETLRLKRLTLRLLAVGTLLVPLGYVGAIMLRRG